MSRFFSILDPFFDALASGAVIRGTIATIFRLFAVLSFITGGVAAIGVIGVSASVGHGTSVIGGLVFGAFWMFSAYVQAGISIYRARTISELGESNFTITTIASVIFRMLGEQLSTFFAIIGVGGCVFVWFTGISPLSSLGSFGSMLPVPSGGGSFGGGLVFAIAMLILAFVALIFCYALAELTLVLVDIAKNMQLMRVAIAGNVTSDLARAVAAGAGAGGGGGFVPASHQGPAVCGNCKAPREPGGVFCNSCGAQFAS